ncbi:MAG: hypothetical protein VB085_12295 [Peptococcaceae bacterium]|nr:hypothetical protein [Peptococcaceae bacterium]
MIKRIDILNAINRILTEAYPEYKVYIDLCPDGYERPSFLLQHAATVREDVNRSTVSEKVEFILFIHEDVDDYSGSSTLTLSEIQQAVLDLFRSGALQVGDRWLRIHAQAGVRDFNVARLTLRVEYFDLREPVQIPEEMIREVALNLTKKE